MQISIYLLGIRKIVCLILTEIYMKKLLTKIITVILSVVMCCAGFAGCNLVTDNVERDLKQVVATVDINQKEEILKKDLVMAYLNYGYFYVQYYGYSMEDTYRLILNNLIDSRIVVQVAYKEFEDKGKIENASAAQYTPERYLTADELIEAKYSAYKAVNDLLDSYTEKTSEKQDALTVELRTVPTDASNAEKDVDKADYVKDIEDNGFDTTSETRRVAFNKVILMLESNELKGEDYKGTIESTDYFKRMLKSNKESKIVSKYENYIVEDIKNNLSFFDLENLYKADLDEQKAWDNEKFVSALSSASAKEPILYSAYGTYGYVYNLLLGVNDYQSTQLEELQEKREHEHLTQAEYDKERAKILAGTIAKDLRSSWILSGYDFDGAKFTGDYTFAKDAANSLAFQGAVTKVREADEDKDISAVYSVESVKTFGLYEFTKFVNKYVYGDESELTLSANANRYYEKAAIADKPTEYDAKINELLFAFSTDPGSLNTYKGYVIKPENTDYVKTFGDAGKALLSEGGSSYKVVATDYGYHFMFFSEVWKVGDGYATLSDYLDTLGIDKGTGTWEDYFNAQKADWDKFEEDNSFLYILANEIISNKLSDVSSQSSAAIKAKYRYGDMKDCTKIYEDAIADLIG